MDASRRRFLELLAAALVTACGRSDASGTVTAPRPTTASVTAPTTAVTPTSLRPTTTTTTTTTTLRRPEVVLDVLCREAWGAAPVRPGLVDHDITRLTIHHTAAVLESNAHAPARIRAHQRFHIGRGWPDLAYHHVVDAHGNVYEGRPLTARGDTGTEYDPTGHYLVCLEGDFDRQPVPELQWQRALDLLAWAAARFDVDPRTVSGHHDWAPSTTCPGADLYPRISDGSAAHAVADRMKHTQFTLREVCDRPGRALVDAIEAGSEASPGTGA